jgi:hypothetical protein
MSASISTSASTRKVAASWFDAVSRGDTNAAAALLHPSIEFINYTPVPGYNTDMPWIGTHRGPQAVLDSFKTFTDICEVRTEILEHLLIEGNEAIGIIRENSIIRGNGQPFEIEFIQHLTISDGLIVRWKSYTDPSPIIKAIRIGTAGTS